ncbi:MAG: MFS transporter [Clostridia bacterium]|nr:MFS transporter [Clostridia bacterium]
MLTVWKSFRQSLIDIYSVRDEDGKGRLISLGSSMITAFYNVFITGIFYTGFLSMYDISITGVGIVTFIPYIANCFSVFSPRVLGRFKKRKWILLAAKVYFYAMYIIATTLMPQFVTDPDGRLKWFIILLFLAYAVYALFSPGLTIWFYRFYPQESERRTRYIAYNQTFSSILSSIMLLVSSVLTDAVEGSAMQDQLILGFRYFAFVLVLVDVAMQAMAKEYPYAEAPKLRLDKVFTIPFRYGKFMLCMVVMFAWNYIGNLNNGLWNYHLLNHLHFSYTVINLVGILYTVILLCTGALWQKILKRYSWIKTFGLACLLFVPTEFLMFSLTPGMEGVWAFTSLIQYFCSVGLNFSYANILYLNLPEEESTACISFNTIGCNIFAFLGMITGTFISSAAGDAPIPFLGMEIYAVQYTTLMRAAGLAAIALPLIIGWKKMTPDHEIALVNQMRDMRRRK